MTSTEPLAEALMAVSRSMVALAARSLTAAGVEVTLTQYRVLVLLAGDGPQRGATVAKELGVAPSTLTRMCDRLVRRSLVQRFHRHHDRRSIWLGLTPAGRDLVGEVMRARRRQIDALIGAEGLAASPPQLALLHAFVRATGELPDAEWWRRWDVSADPVDGAVAIYSHRTGHAGWAERR
ncbi:MarR family winged helix-turn-helix transcriptional regulator [Dactylosporangium sp. CA-092794]|uniref:MarR family winged helix-turn-helix transcriptional regulator n=1 Tax=Dactylosporangium sp. CA-092794 TaxID=3239929 RepID=UPI003D92D3E7